MKRLFVWVDLITGVLPGMIVILHGFGTPEELRMPFGILAAACGLVAFGVVILIKKAVSRGGSKGPGGAHDCFRIHRIGFAWRLLDCFGQVRLPIAPAFRVCFSRCGWRAAPKRMSTVQEGAKRITSATGPVRFQLFWKAKPQN